MSTLLSITTYYSLLSGVLSPRALCAAAKQAGYAAVALTDKDNLYGLPEFLKACKAYEIKPIIGARISDEHTSALVYAQGKTGYANLCKLITKKQCADTFTLCSSLETFSDGLRMVTDDISLIKKLTSNVEVYYKISSLQKIPPSIKEHKIPCLVIPEVVFTDSAQHHLYTLLRAIDKNTTLTQESFPPAADLQSWAQLCGRFGVFEEALRKTEKFADSLESYTGFGAPIMPRFDCTEGPEELLRAKSFSGALQRYGLPTNAVTQRLNYELDLITRKGFASYFLVVDDIVRQSPRTCGRGSAAASCVAYCLGITNVDPIRYNLMFERFLNPGRIDPPDIDVDFAWDERDAVLQYVFTKYGNGRAAMVANHLTFQPRMAMREIGRIYGMTESEMSGVTKKFPYIFELGSDGVDICGILARHPRTKHIPLDPPWPEIIRFSQKLIAIPRGIGTHCGGVIITPEPVSSYVPVQYSAQKGFPVIQWEKDGAEQMGLVKIDLLGNRSLAVIRDAIGNIRTDGVVFDEKKWDPATDAKTANLLASGNTMGVFYVESPAMRLLQKKTRRGDFDHMVIHSSIIRPAANKYIIAYIKRLRGEPYTTEHPLLDTVLHETFGIMVYQEDVARVAMAMAGFTPEQADGLRKIMSKKDRHATLQDYRQRFFTGAQARGVSPEAITSVWEMCLSFTGYSFCKPHSASYVQVSMQSAYLKTWFPAAFMAAVLSNYGGFYTTQAYISEAQRMGITILPPDVNRSEKLFFSHGLSIRVGLCQIKGIGNTAMTRILEARQGGNAYTSLFDLLSRTAIDQSDAENLVYAGACDLLEPEKNRPRLFWQMRSFYKKGACHEAPELKTYSRAELLRAEYNALGFLTVCHPITLVKKKETVATVKICDITKRYLGKTIAFYGWCVTAKTILTKYGDPMQFVTFEDATGICETVLFPGAYSACVKYLISKDAFLVTGNVMQEFDVLMVGVEWVEPV